MRLRERYGGDTPFEGERELRLDHIPAGAQVQSARATLTPRMGEGGGASLETVDFEAGGETWGATKSRVDQGGSGWVEVDFHARRTLHSVRGSGLAGSSLQIDLGGAFAAVKADGTLMSAADAEGDAFTLDENSEDGDELVVPGLSVARFRLRNDGSAPDLDQVQVRSVPSQVSLAFPGRPPFWVLPGERTRPRTSDDFAPLLQAFLEEAEVEGGFHRFPLILHSDSIACLEVVLEVELLRTQSALPPRLDRVVLDYAFDGLPKSAEGPAPLEVTVPAGSRVRATAGRALGAFEESRVVFGEFGEVVTTGEALVSPQTVPAQPLRPEAPLLATAVDLLIAVVSPTARLQLDVVGDLDGKPGGTSLLARPVEIPLSRERAGRPTWVSAPLPAEFSFQPERTYWLSLQSLEGEARWRVRAAPEGALALQQTEDGGLSWRRSGPEARQALLRLRHRPDRFSMPVEVQVGTGEEARRKTLDALAARGDVDLDLGFPAIAEAFDAYLAGAPPACPEAEHLDNGEFELWISPGGEAGEVPVPEAGDFAGLLSGRGFGGMAVFATAVELPPPSAWLPSEWAVSGPVRPVPTPEAGVYLVLGALGDEPDVPSSVSQVVPVRGGCTYELAFEGVATVEDAVAEVRWLGEACAALGRGTVAMPFIGVQLGGSGDGETSEAVPDPRRRLRLMAPPEAIQAEVRFLAPAGALALRRASFRGSTDTATDGEMIRVEEGLPAAWELRPPGADGFFASPGKGGATSLQGGSEAASLVQTVDLGGDGGSAGRRDFRLAFEGAVPADRPAAEARLTWLDAEATPVGSPETLTLRPDTPGLTEAEGTVPEAASEARLELVVPAGGRLELERISLRLEEPRRIPVTFPAQAPGELQVRDWQVLYEPAEPVRPPVPEEGLCAPTLPDPPPGEAGGKDRKHGKHPFCSRCGRSVEMVKAEPRVTEGGRALEVGECRDCGGSLVRFTGGAVRSDSAQPFVPARRMVLGPALPQPAPPLARTELQLTDIDGVAERRARQLREIGIASVADLAAARPGDLTELPGMIGELPETLIARAAARISEERGG